MTSSRSNSSISKLLVLAIWLGLVATAAAGKRKRVVVLPFEGDEQAEKFHSAVIRLVKKTHTVVPVSKWERAAEKLSAARVNDRNIKKVAAKLRVDGVIEGKVDKRRDAYILRLKLRSGSTGAIAAKMETKADGTKLKGDAAKDVKGELIAPIQELDGVGSAKGGGDDDDDEEDEPKPVAKKKSKKGGDDDEDDEDEPRTKKKKKGFGSGKMDKGDDDEEDEPKSKKSSAIRKDKDAKKDKKNDDDDEDVLETKKDKDDDDDAPLPKAKKRSKKDKDVAAKDDDEEIEDKAEPRVKMDQATALSPGNRAIDATVGVSFTARRLSFQADGDLQPSGGVMGQGRPPAYKGTPAPGAVVDITAYPLAFGHSSRGMLKNIGLSVMYDQALLISSEAGGEKKKTVSNRYAVGGVFRYPLGTSPTALVVGASVTYGGQKFQVEGPVDLPNVNYAMLSPGAFLHFPLSEKMIINTAVSYMLISKTGQMTKGDATGYGKGTVSGIDAELSGDYMVTPKIFARAALKVETIGYKFNNNAGTLATDRDADPEQDVFGARDTYLGAAVTLGYLY